MRLEGGFQGRVNKLVDGCYSFWQAGSFPLLEGIYTKNKKPYGNSFIYIFLEIIIPIILLTTTTILIIITIIII